MKPNKLSDMANLLLSTQTALLERVRPNLRAVLVDVDTEEKVLFFNFFFDGQISEKDREIAIAVANEASSAFEKGFQIKNRIERLDHPENILCEGRWAYQRNE